MIKIDKGVSPPNLKADHDSISDRMCGYYNGNSANYRSGALKFEFGDEYKTDEVKKALIKVHFNKCCFSEAKFVGDYMDVEHFRPKGRVDTYGAKGTKYPGYYWLAYDWDNLFLCKNRLNTSQKRNYFPLYDESNRNISHNDNFDEAPKLIDPSKEDPRDYIRFHLEEPISIDKEERGQFNIDFFNLNHPEFEEARRSKLAFLRTFKKSVEVFLSKGMSLDDPEIIYILDILRESMDPKSEFSSMAIDFLQDWPPLQ